LIFSQHLPLPLRARPLFTDEIPPVFHPSFSNGDLKLTFPVLPARVQTVFPVRAFLSFGHVLFLLIPRNSSAFGRHLFCFCLPPLFFTLYVFFGYSPLLVSEALLVLLLFRKISLLFRSCSTIRDSVLFCFLFLLFPPFHPPLALRLILQSCLRHQTFCSLDKTWQSTRRRPALSTLFPLFFFFS